MSTTPLEPTPTEPVEPTPPAQLPDDHPLVKAYAAQKDQIKQLKSAQIDPDELARLRNLDEATKTETQKQAEALAAAQAKVKEYEIREQITNWKTEVAEATGVPAVALAGSTKEEIEAHAETLKPLIAQQTTEQPKPAVVPTVGKTPTALPNIPINEQIAAAEAAGDKELVGRLKAMQLGSLSATT